MVKVTFLGTGTSQGVPVVACDCQVCNSIDYRDKRTRSSVLIETEGVVLVIDTGPDFRAQLLREKISKLDAVLFTHPHKDHTAGLDEVRSFNYKYQMDMPIYGTEGVIRQLQQEFAYIFSEKKYPGVPNIATFLIDNQQHFFVNGVEITPIEVMHYKLPVTAFRIEDFTYITDANFIEEKELQKIIGTKVLVINALRKEPHISHFNLEQALEVIEKIKPDKAYLTHISHYLGSHREVSKELPDNVFIAFDGLKLQV